MPSFRSLSLVAALWGTTLGACAASRDPIDRTQPNAIDKEILQGEWYYGQTVVDIPATLSHTFIGENNFQGLDRIRWDIQENWLYARRSFERIQDGEGNISADGTTPDGRPYLGSIIAAYKVVSHFDIKRAYNPSTGEEMNVIEENSWDRPWYERRYMRVDWSKNYASNFQYLVDDVEQDPVAYYVQDPNDPDYPIVDPGKFAEDGTMIEAPYIDVTNVVMARPGMIYIPELGESYPACWFFDRENADCVTEPIKIRNSFLRIDPARQYVPKKFKGPITDHFGLFTQERLVWDVEQDINQRNRVSYAQLHNLWRTWLDQNGNLLAAKDRGVRPMVYYAINWPEDVDSTLRSVEMEWNRIFQRAVAAAMGQPSYDGPVFVVCHSPVSAARGDNLELCGEEGKTVRIGDIRYSTIVYVSQYYDGFKLLGFGPSNTDPLTGETISASAYLYIWNENRVQSTIEQIQLLNGDMNPYAYIDGVDLTPWQEQAKANRGGEALRLVTDAELAGYVGAQNYDWAKGLGFGTTPEKLAQFRGRPMREVLAQVAPVLHERGLFSGERDDSDARLASLQGTYIENLLLNDEIKAAAGIAPRTPVSAMTEEMLRNASVARLGPMRVLSAMERFKQQLAHKRTADFAIETTDDGLSGLAWKLTGMTQDEIRPIIKDKVFHAVLAHELGHTFTLHHNMGATEDVVNYFDQYWELRAADGTVKPRWQDPVTEDEIEGEIYKYAYSSIMDYSRLTQDYGPGKYDAAAILLAYGDKVEVFKRTGNVPFGLGQANYFAEWAESDGDVLIFELPRPLSMHYTKWWEWMGTDLYDPDNRDLVDASQIDWSAHMSSDGRPRVPYIFCSPFQTDLSNGCLTRDYGADPYERMKHHIQMANTWYVTRSFTRYRVGAMPESYVGATYDRLYRRVKEFNDYYALINGLLVSFGWNPSDMQTFLQDGETGWGAYTIAIHDAVNFLLSTIAMPDVTSYELQTDPAGEQHYGLSLFSTPTRTNVTTGRYFTTSWSDTSFSDSCGMYFYQCLHHFGFYLDKIMALHALTDAETYFVARDTAEDLRQWRISFWDNYSDVIENFLGALMAQDYSEYAPRWVDARNVKHPDYACPTCSMPSGTPVDPATGFTVQLYAAVLGQARLQNNFDKRFLDSSRMWLQGSPFAITPSGVGTVSYTDDDTGKTYVALDYPNGVAARMIERARRVKTTLAGCGSDAACIAKAKADLTRYADLLDIMVDLTGYYETSSPGYGDPYNPGEL